MLAGAVLLLVGACSVYVQHPHFAGSSPSSIALTLYAPASSEISYQTNITDIIGCKALVAGLRKGRFVMFGAKADGELNISYGDGKTDRVGFTRSSDGHCEFFQHGFYSMRSNEFFQVLADAGIDVSRVATNWNYGR